MNDTLLTGSLLVAAVTIGFWVLCFIAAFKVICWIMDKIDGRS
jgi:preprotein translocase subunit SecE